ncbi:hypothetical protein UFOVP273_111 [uncultured Caudovirales phage]|uniref:Uncharacterized protein n=1 Tax=uncultured Caudovirales phage TaxID=2100421 RepID=A0A6J5LLU7_9CAUD|nr:hypothetical protein UFOVP273_111 [uncultured Caudovirales phage]
MTYFRFIEALEKDLDALEQQVAVLEEKLEKLESFVYGVTTKSNMVESVDEELDWRLIKGTIHG